MTKPEMLKEIASYYNIEKNIDFANFFGISAQNAYQKVKQGIMDYEEIYKRGPDISADWLLSGGEGEMLRANRIENTGNINYGNNSRQMVRMHETESVKKALDALSAEQAALSKEQDALAKAQDQISGLISILQSR